MTNVNPTSLLRILQELGIYSEDFWYFLNGKVKSFPQDPKGFPWACFPILDSNGTLIDIRVLVPNIVDKETLLINIHEFAHAYELYGLLGKKYNENTEKSEKFAISKEQEYLGRNRM